MKHQHRLILTSAAGIVAIVLGTLTTTPAFAQDAPPGTLEPGSVISLEGQSGFAGSSSSDRCTLAYITVNDASDPSAITAGHCGEQGAQVYLGSTLIGEISQSVSPATLPGGFIVGSTTEPDWALIDLNNRSDITLDPSSERINPTKVANAAIGDEVCTQGSTSGWACGKVIGLNQGWISTDIVRAAGDSGGPLWRPADQAALGILGHIEEPIIGGGAATSEYFDLATALRSSDVKLATD